MDELKCSVCDSTSFYGPSVFNERLFTKINLSRDIPPEDYYLAYTSRMMCKNCGRIIEIPTEVKLNLHELAKLSEARE